MAIKVEVKMETMQRLQRKAELLEGALAWICDHTDGYEEYAHACMIVGMNNTELDNEMAECGLSREETEQILSIVRTW